MDIDWQCQHMTSKGRCKRTGTHWRRGVGRFCTQHFPMEWRWR